MKRAVIEHISKIGEREFKEFTITKRRLKQVKAIGMVRQAREEGNQSVGYSSRPFIRRSSQPAKTGHFYSATNRTFLLGVDKDILRDDPCNKVHYNARLEGRNFAPDK